MRARIKELASQLRLGSNVAELCKDIEFSSPEQFTCELLEKIATRRAANKTMLMKKQAGFDSWKTLDNFDFSNISISTGYSVEWMTSCKFIEEKINLIHLGNPGTGKTHLSIALGMRAAELGYRPMFRRTTKLIEELTRLHEAGKLRDFKRRFEQYDLLILDEWGYVPIHVNGTRLLFDLISELCYEKRSVILTTNLPIPEWNRIFEDERLVRGMADRLIHYGLLVRHEGESYRIKHALTNLNSSSPKGRGIITPQ